MKHITACILGCLLLALNAAGAAPKPSEYDDVGSISARYGLVQYRKEYGSLVWINGQLIYDRMGTDRLTPRGYFKLKDRDVVLFEGANGGSGGDPGETFFVILRPDSAPKIVKARIGPLANRVKKAWSEGEVVFVDFEVSGYQEFKSPLRLVGEKVVVSTAPTIMAIKAEDCSRVFDIAKNSCMLISTKHRMDCTTQANAKGWIGESNSEAGFLRWISGQRSFRESTFNEACRTWCQGGNVTYERFSKSVCSIH